MVRAQKVFLPGIEPGTLSVLDSRDNHYTTETQTFAFQKGHHKNKLSEKTTIKHTKCAKTVSARD